MDQISPTAALRPQSQVDKDAQASGMVLPAPAAPLPLDGADQSISAPLDSDGAFRPFKTVRPALDVEHEGASPVGEKPDVTVARTQRSERREDLDLTSARVRRAVLPLPNKDNEPSLFSKLWFLLALVAPIGLGAFYLLFIAANQYVCEFHFSVREPIAQQNASSSSSLSALFGGNPTPGSDLLDNFMVSDYVSSDQAARDLQARVDIRRMFSAPVHDPFSRFNPKQPPEKLASYWKRMVYSNYDPATGLAIVRVRAFSAQDSYRIATTLVALSNELVNTIGVKSQEDSLRFAQQEVDRNQKQVASLRAELSRLRLTEGVIDPSNNSTVSGNAALATTLRANLAQFQTQINALTAQLHNPNAPQIAVLRQQLQATQRQLSVIGGEVGRNSPGQSALARTVGQFEDANTRLTDTTQVLLNNINNLTAAQSAADAQRLYITTYVRPSLPDSSTYPNRFEDLALLILISTMVWLIGLLVANSVLEHAA